MKNQRVRKASVFDFNHITPNISDDEINTLKALYCRYHYKCWVYKKAYLNYKKKDLIITAASAVITTGGLAGATVFLPAVGIGACGIVLAVIAKKKNYPRKIEMCRYAYTSYQKILNQLKAYLRGDSYDKNQLIHELNILDDNVTDLCPPVDRWREKYYERHDRVHISPRHINYETEC